MKFVCLCPLFVKVALASEVPVIFWVVDLQGFFHEESRPRIVRSDIEFLKALTHKGLVKYSEIHKVFGKQSSSTNSLAPEGGVSTTVEAPLTKWEKTKKWFKGWFGSSSEEIVEKQNVEEFEDLDFEQEYEEVAVDADDMYKCEGILLVVRGMDWAEAKGTCERIYSQDELDDKEALNLVNSMAAVSDHEDVVKATGKELPNMESLMDEPEARKAVSVWKEFEKNLPNYDSSKTLSLDKIKKMMLDKVSLVEPFDDLNLAVYVGDQPQLEVRLLHKTPFVKFGRAEIKAVTQADFQLACVGSLIVQKGVLFNEAYSACRVKQPSEKNELRNRAIALINSRVETWIERRKYIEFNELQDHFLALNEAKQDYIAKAIEMYTDLMKTKDRHVLCVGFLLSREYPWKDKNSKDGHSVMDACEERPLNGKIRAIVDMKVSFEKSKRVKISDYLSRFGALPKKSDKKPVLPAEAIPVLEFWTDKGKTGEIKA